MKFLLLFEVCLLFTTGVYGQGCLSMAIGSRASNSNNCGTTVFVQNSVPACLDSFFLPRKCSVHGADTLKNPVSYSFYGLKNGTLNFTIHPEEPSDDYNWVLLDVVSPILDTVYRAPFVIGGNWSAKRGKTGASAQTTDSLVCATTSHSPYSSPFSAAPHITKGHSYQLVVSHNTGSKKHGYTLSFGEGSDAIVDTIAPPLKSAKVACDGRSITVFLTKKTIKITPHLSLVKGINPGSLAADGSDFKLLHTAVDIQSASTRASGRYMTQLTLHLDSQLKPGQYTLVLQKGSDGNTLVGNCSRNIPVGETLQFEKIYIPQVTMKNVVKPDCKAQSIQVAFADQIKCSSIAADGSDFILTNIHTGKQLTISGAESVHCNYNFSDTVRIYLKHPIAKTGKYLLVLKQGTDGNTALSRCGAAPSGQELIFESKGAVSAVIKSKLQYKCNQITVALSNPGKNGISQWQWSTSTGKINRNATFSFINITFKPQTVKLRVSNGSCSAEDSIKLTFNKDYYLHAAFSMPSSACPQDPVKISNESKGTHIAQWHWNFGNGQYGHLEHPEIQHYRETTKAAQQIPVSLSITNSKGCKDTATKFIEVSNTCSVYVPTAFTPNNDGENDDLRPLHIYQVQDFSFRVYSRWGQLVFQSGDRTLGWDGTYQGKPLPAGSYIWVLRFVHSQTGKQVFRKGTVVLIR